MKVDKEKLINDIEKVIYRLETHRVLLCLEFRKFGYSRKQVHSLFLKIAKRHPEFIGNKTSSHIWFPIYDTDARILVLKEKLKELRKTI